MGFISKYANCSFTVSRFGAEQDIQQNGIKQILGNSFYPSRSHDYHASRRAGRYSLISLLFLVVVTACLSGCAGGGYAGGGITSLSSSAINIDAGQSFLVNATVTGTSQVVWSLSCTSGCGTLSNTVGASATYTAPAGIAAPLKLTLLGAIAGTKSQQTVSITVNPNPVIAGTPAPGTVGVAYSTTLTSSGGTGPLKWGAIVGSLPPGLTFNATTGVISGTPTLAGQTAFIAQATDASDVPYTVSAQKTILISNAGAVFSVTGNPQAGSVGAAYSTTFQATAGAAPYTWSVSSGVLPAGLSLSASTGTLSGTPSLAGTSGFTVQAIDSTGSKASNSFSIAIASSSSPLTITSSSLPNGTVGTPYAALIGVSGGTAPYTCAILSGNLPAGLALAPNCLVSGTPTVAGTFNLIVRATDNSNPAQGISSPVSITILPVTTLTITSPPPATANVPYTGTIGVTGGTGPYTCTVIGGTLPAGLTLGAGCVISGTPTVPGGTTVTVKTTDSSSPTATGTGPVTITVAPTALSLSVTTLPNGTVGAAYSAVIGVAGGTGPYTCSITTGTLPAGLTLGANCLVSGTPTVAGTSNLTVHATDSSNPVETTNGPISITIVPAALSFSVTTLANGAVNIPYSSTIGLTGGTGPYTCTVTTGTLPAGLTLGANCLVSGTPTIAGTSNLTVRATDSSNPTETANGPISITIAPASLSFSVTTLPNGTVSVPYSSTIGLTGGTGPYTCTITTGTIPAGLTLGANCLVSGTPTIAGTSNLVIHATDSSNPVLVANGPVSITIQPATSLTITSPPVATVNLPYTGTIGVTGGTGPYTCTLTTGTLPAGLTLGAGCVVSGTPTVTGSTTVTVTTHDSSSPAATTTGPVTLTVNPATATLTLASPPDATVGTPYTGTISVSGGTAPYACTLTAGTLPAGLVLGAGCAITGTPTVAGPVTVTVTATDAGSPVKTGTGPVTIQVLPMPPLTLTGSLPNGIIGIAYSQTLHAAGGIAPYTYSLTAGALPAGLTLSAAGVISGIPTAPGASSFTVTVTDNEPTPQTAALPLVLLITYPTTPTDGALTGPYAFLFQGYDDVLAGVLAYRTATVGSFTADGAGIVTAGELDSNHQTSNPTGTTITSNALIGTYTIGTDYRGSLAITPLNADGTTGTTAVYAIALNVPVAPATVSTKASMIQFDNDQLTGTKGSGSILAQQPAAFTAGLNGSYAFGLSGDTPCLPTCTIGVIAGPAASVGQFVANGAGVISGGAGDENVATTKFANSSLSGIYSTADGNGRVQMSLQTSGTINGVYPTDFAVYMVSGEQAFILSTDKHSNYILLSGSTRKQTQSLFSNASMTGPYVGYENSPTNPGLVGQILGNTLNLSTATVFRGTADAAGNCNTTNVDVAGLTGVVNALTGLGSNVPILNALLGTYQSTGISACTVSSNGRGVLDYAAPDNLLAALLTLLGLANAPPPSRVFYLVAPNQGYFLETGYAGLGNFEPQTGSPFTLATLDGTYIYASEPSSSLASINGSGTFTADGAGHAVTTIDQNVGVGTINILQLGVTGTSNYSLTDATAGRYLLGTNTAIYAISPNNFILLDLNPLATSPSIVLLY